MSTGQARLRAFALVAVIAVGTSWAVAPAAQQPLRPDVDSVLRDVGQRVQQWYGRAQSIVSVETVAIQPLRYDMAPDGFPRRLSYELRVAWDPDQAAPGEFPEATILRQLITINGRPPRPRDEPGCMDPKSVSPEPLTMLLPSHRERFRFSLAGTTRVDGRAALMIDYQGVVRGAPKVEWTKECVSIELPGRSRGRIWVDAESHDVVRLDEQLVGLFDFAVPREHARPGSPTSMTIERADSSIRYRRVEFDDPPETLMLPASVDIVQIVRGGGVQRHRISQRFTDYRRFVTEGRILN